MDQSKKMLHLDEEELLHFLQLGSLLPRPLPLLVSNLEHFEVHPIKKNIFLTLASNLEHFHPILPKTHFRRQVAHLCSPQTVLVIHRKAETKF